MIRRNKTWATLSKVSHQKELSASYELQSLNQKKINLENQISQFSLAKDGYQNQIKETPDLSFILNCKSFITQVDRAISGLHTELNATVRQIEQAQRKLLQAQIQTESYLFLDEKNKKQRNDFITTSEQKSNDEIAQILFNKKSDSI